MSNFNDYFRSQCLSRLMDSFLTGVDKYTTDTKITKLNYYIEEDEVEHPATYYIENGLSSEFNVRVDYELNNDGEILTDYVRFPKEINNTFIVDGDYRISTSVLVKENDIRFRTEDQGGRRITSVIFDWNRRYIINDRKLIITNLDQFIEGSIIKRKDVLVTEINELLSTPEGKQLLRLSEKQSLKLQIKLNLDFVPEYIDERLLLSCSNVEDDRNFDYIVDKSIKTAGMMMMDYMLKDDNRENFRKTKRQLTTHFKRYKKLQLSYITNLARRFVKKGSAQVQIPPGINPINLDGFKSKVQIHESVAYNSSMSDLIDIADTPINNNTNLQNNLTVSTHLTDTGVDFDVYDKKFKRIRLDYLKYLNSKVVASEYVDYETNELKPVNGEVEVKYRMKRVMVPVKEIDYIDLHPDYRLSSTARRIPFVNYTDSVRVSMGASMLRQSITLMDPDKPLVDTGNNSELAENVMTERYNGTKGKVIDITEDEVVIKDEASDNPIRIKKHSVIKSINNVGLFSSAKVKVGDNVKNGDIIISAVGIEPDTARTGINAKVLFHAYKGLTNEDAVVVSESYSRKMAHYSIIDIDINIRANSKVEWILTPGTRVKSKDILVKIVKTGRLNEVNAILNEKLGGLIKDDDGNPLSSYVIDNSVVVPNNISNAVVSDVLIKRNNPKFPRSSRDNEKTLTFARTSEEVLTSYEESYDRTAVYEEFPDYISQDRLQDFITDKKDLRLVYVIKVRLIVMNELKVGDKLTNRYGGKGVISMIIPDDEMPRVNGEPVGIIMNPYSIIGRKIPSVVMEIGLSNVAMKLYEMTTRMIDDGRKDEILPLLNKYYGNKFKKMRITEFLRKYKEQGLNLFSFDVGCFSSITPDIIQKWMDELGVSTSSDAEIPALESVDLTELKENMSEDEYNSYVESLKGKFTRIDRPLMYGSMYMLKLYHVPEAANKVTSDMSDNKYGQPILGGGRYRRTGQKIGEMELNALLARNATEFIQATRESSSKEDSQLFLNNLLGLGLRVVDESGYSLGGSEQKNAMKRLKNKYQGIKLPLKK